MTKKRQTFSVRRPPDSGDARMKRARAFGNTVLGEVAQGTYMDAHRIMDEHGGVTPASIQAVGKGASALMFQMAAHIPSKSPAACKAGCSWCCQQAVAAWPIEVFVLAEWLRARRTAGELQSLQERLRDDVEEKDRQLAKGQRSTRVRCALLGVDERCTAYNVRPSACLGWNMSDAAQCEAWAKGDDHAGSMYNAAQVAIPVAIWKGSGAAVTDRGGPAARQVDFHSALLAVLEGGDGALEAWLSGVDLFAKASRRLTTRTMDAVDAG